MARYCGEMNSALILEAAAYWRDRALLSSKGVFIDADLWSMRNLEAVQQYYVNRPDVGEGDFLSKLQKQLEPAEPQVKQLVAEMLWVMFLCPSNMGPDAKRLTIREIWSWSDESLPTESRFLSDKMLGGIGSGGPGYHQYRWKELVFFVRLMLAFKGLSAVEGAALLSDGWKMAEWVEGVSDASSRQFRHMFLFLLFPDQFERIFGGADRARIVEHFLHIGKSTLQRMQSVQIDRHLSEIRATKVRELGREDIDFYISPLKELWNPAPEAVEEEGANELAPTGGRYWVEKTLVAGRPDRQAGEHALGKALWSPQLDAGGRDIYGAMRKVSPGDVVFHLIDNNEISGVSIVNEAVDETFTGLASTDWQGRPGYRIALRDFVKLSPGLNRADFLGNNNFKDRLRAIAASHRGLFYSRMLELNQGAYLTEAPLELVALLNEAYMAKTGQSLPIDAIALPVSATSAWIFQANPRYYDIDKAVRELGQIRWLVKQYGGSIKAGHRVYIWRSGEEAGIVATGVILNDPRIEPSNPIENPYVLAEERFSEPENCVNVEITQVFSTVVTRDELRALPGLENLSIIRFPNRTNFAVTASEATAIDALLAEREIVDRPIGFPPRVEEPQPNPPIQAPVQLPPAEPYSIEQAMDGLFIAKEDFERILSLLDRKQNVILQGPPGVGKTFFAKRLAYALMERSDSGRFKMVQFHQSYGYEDFVQGYRPASNGFALRNGVFYDFCVKALRDPSYKYVFVIDEINRGNLSKIFGELLMLIEGDKRGDGFAVPLVYSSEPFVVPKNLYLLGLMNTADRSLAVVDYALRRRFAFVDLEPQISSPQFRDFLLGCGAPSELTEKIVSRLSELNNEIAKDKVNLGPGFCIGHSYFCRAAGSSSADDAWYMDVIDSEIVPLLREYWFDDPSKADAWEKRLKAS